LDAPGVADELARVDGMFDSIGAFLTSSGICLPEA
jgi:hypothetical protein